MLGGRKGWNNPLGLTGRSHGHCFEFPDGLKLASACLWYHMKEAGYIVKGVG